MDIAQALATAANIMLLGMVCVFVFLGLLVIAIKLLERVAREDAPSVDCSIVRSPPQVDNNVIAAISAAVHQYRRSKSND
jgi:oxaloacetate decarboxylase gamma subunit